MTRIKYMIVWLLILMMTISIFVGCQPTTSTTSQTTKGTTKTTTTTTATTATTATTVKTIDKITNIMRSDYQVNFAGTEFDKWIQDTFGLEIELTIIDPGSYTEKFQVMWNTGDLADITQFSGVSPGDIDVVGDKGALLNVFDYIDYMPTLKGRLVENSDSLRLVVSGSGNMYRIPISYGMGDRLGVGTGLMVRNDILKTAGFDKDAVKSVDDIYKMFETLKSVDPDKFVLSVRGGIGNLSNMGHFCYGISANPAVWRDSNEAYIACYREPAFKEWLTFWADAFADKILHPEFLNMQAADLWQNFYDGTLSAAIDTMANITHISNNSSVEGSEWSHVIFPEYNGTRYGIPSYSDLSASSNTKIISSKTKAPEKIMAFIDWMFTNEGYLRTQWGIEDEDYVLLNKDPLQFVVLSEVNKDYIPSGYEDKLWTAEERIKRMVSQPYYFYGWYNTNCRWSILQTTPKGDSLYGTAYKAYEAAGLWRDPQPAISLSGAEQTEYTDLITAITTMAHESISKIIVGQMSVSDWDGILEQIEAAGYERLMELYELSYQNYLKVKPNFNP